MILATPKNSYVLSVGGSVFAPNGKDNRIDIKYLHDFEVFIRKQIAKDRRFFLICGGGYTARQYRDAAKQAAGHDLTDEDLDWLGIHATRLNAHLFRTIFRDVAYPWILKHFDMVDKNAVNSKIVIGGGWKPGWSTDYCAALMANDYHLKTVINLSNIDQVYDKDPHQYPDAKPIKKMSWKELTGLIGKEWRPGMNAPFDPIASQLAQKIKLKVIICNGHDFENLEKVLDGKSFIGTVIE
jgi:uridylate kinase